MSWYKKKYYPHFDLPLKETSAKQFIEEFRKTSNYAFYPLLSYNQRLRHFKGQNRSHVKKRPIKYAAHKDGYIYSYYAEQLAQDYESKIKRLGIEESIIAYRAGIGSNINFAKAAFHEIKRRKSCVAIAMDISGFFDNIDHQNLKKEWCSTINVDRLPRDHFLIYRSLTQWAEVDRDSCFNRLKEYKSDFNKHKPQRPLCVPEEFRKIIKGKSPKAASLIMTNFNKFGIPQGTALSALLSNIYMIPFDLAMITLANSINGYYRRYSDDILWIADSEHQDKILKYVDENLNERGDRLLRKDEKTDISVFRVGVSGAINCNKPFQYLGFTFDGKKILIRSKTLSKYWRRLIYSVKRTKRTAKKIGKSGKKEKPFRKKIYRLHSHLGSKNFVKGYAYKAQKIMGRSAEIRHQLSKHMDRINKEFDK